MMLFADGRESAQSSCFDKLNMRGKDPIFPLTLSLSKWEDRSFLRVTDRSSYRLRPPPDSIGRGRKGDQAMIEDPPLLTIRRNFPRPSAERVAALAGALTGHVVDCLGGRGALDGRIKAVGRAAGAFCGVALPCEAGPADNLAVFAALDAAQAGDVIVASADGFAETAVVGDLVLGMMKNRGLAGFVTDGFARDIEGIEAVGLPCFGAGVTPNSPARNGPGTVGLPAIVGGVRVEAGDIVLGDIDGVVVVPQARIDAVIARLEAVRAAEADLDAKVKAGLEVPDFIAEVLASGRVKEVE